MANLSPIVLFVYNRLWHTKKTIEALQKNKLASDSELFIYADGARNEKENDQVLQVNNYIKKVDGFKKVIIIERDNNWGLANSVIDGVTQIVNKYGRVIVLEDDLVTSKYFLTYMNKTLDIFQHNDQVGSISGFSFTQEFMQFPSNYKRDVYFHYRPMSWGWATWKGRWNNTDWQVEDFFLFIKDKKKKKEFSKYGPDVIRMLKKQMKGEIDSWYIRWTYSSYKKGFLTVYPIKSFINNIGHDESGVHCSKDKDMILSHSELVQHGNFKIENIVVLDSMIVKSFNKAFAINARKIIRKIVKIVFNKV